MLFFQGFARQNRLFGAALIGGALLLATSAKADTDFFKAGFETSEGYNATISGPITIDRGAQSTTFERMAGALIGQPSTDPFAYSYLVSGPDSADFPESAKKAVNAVTVVNSLAASGTQSVEVNGITAGAQSLRYLKDLNLVAGTGGVLTVGADVRVDNPSLSFGQWGIQAFGLSGNFIRSFAAFGFVGEQVLASNDGTNIYAAIDLNTGKQVTANYGSFNNYTLQFNYDTRTVSGFFNGNQVGFLPVDFFGNPIGDFSLDMPFRTIQGDSVNFIGFGQALEGTNETGYFDNLHVSGVNLTVAAPEPGTLALLGVGFVGVLVRRRKTL